MMFVVWRLSLIRLARLVVRFQCHLITPHVKKSPGETLGWTWKPVCLETMLPRRYSPRHRLMQCRSAYHQCPLSKEKLVQVFRICRGSTLQNGEHTITIIGYRPEVERDLAVEQIRKWEPFRENRLALFR